MKRRVAPIDCWSILGVDDVMIEQKCLVVRITMALRISSDGHMLAGGSRKMAMVVMMPSE